jgi:hypothetical protein
MSADISNATLINKLQKKVEHLEQENHILRKMIAHELWENHDPDTLRLVDGEIEDWKENYE